MQKDNSRKAPCNCKDFICPFMRSLAPAYKILKKGSGHEKFSQRHVFCLKKISCVWSVMLRSGIKNILKCILGWKFMTIEQIQNDTSTFSNHVSVKNMRLENTFLENMPFESTLLENTHRTKSYVCKIYFRKTRIHTQTNTHANNQNKQTCIQTCGNSAKGSCT